MVPQFVVQEVRDYQIPLTFIPKTVLDIGANVGAFTLAARKIWPDAQIFAYEPVKANADEFRKNVGAMAGVDFVQAAVGALECEADIKIGNQGVACSMYDLGRQTKETERVKVVAAASLPACEFVKIDTEGAELDILPTLNLAECKAMVVEFHRGGDRRKIMTIALKAGLYLHENCQIAEDLGILKFTREIYDDRLFVAVPVYGEEQSHFSVCLGRLLTNPPVPLTIRRNVGDSLVSRSRNTLTAEFLESNCGSMLFLDSDLIFSPEHVRLIAERTEPVVGGLYPKKQRVLEWVLNGMLTPTKATADGLLQVRYIGTGFMRIKRQVFIDMVERFGGDIRYTPDHEQGRIEHDFWTVGVYRYPDGGARYLSEDWFFCQRCLDMGLKVWADTRFFLKHIGVAVYPLEAPNYERAQPDGNIPGPGNGAPGNA